MDYEIKKDYRLLYFQRNRLIFSNQGSLGHSEFQLQDPRLGIRMTQNFDHVGLTTTYDLYIQPGVTRDAQKIGRNFDFGVRTNTSYDISGSRMSIGAITDISVSSFNQSGSAADLVGVAALWGSYLLNTRLSSQHWVVVPFKHQQGTALTHFSFDLPNMPVAQNGVGVSVSKRMWTSLMLNNYLFAVPSLRNTWASMWFNLTIF
jgi:hypothetical protein